MCFHIAIIWYICLVLCCIPKYFPMRAFPHVKKLTKIEHPYTFYYKPVISSWSYFIGIRFFVVLRFELGALQLLGRPSIT
jgi:hypothetical protein